MTFTEWYLLCYSSLGPISNLPHSFLIDSTVKVNANIAFLRPLLQKEGDTATNLFRNIRCRLCRWFLHILSFPLLRCYWVSHPISTHGFHLLLTKTVALRFSRVGVKYHSWHEPLPLWWERLLVLEQTRYLGFFFVVLYEFFIYET